MANKITERGIHTLKSWERYRATPYNDGKGVISIGFGHSSLSQIYPFTDISMWTIEYATIVLYADLAEISTRIDPEIKVEIPDDLYSCIMSLCYNKGVGRLIRSDNWKILHDTSDKYHKEAFCESILKYAIEAPNKVTGEMEEKKGLRWRRIAEAALFLQDRSQDYK